MIKKLEAQFDAVSLVLFLALFFGAVCLTSVTEYVLFFFLPLVFLIKKIIFGSSFIRKVCFQGNPLLSFIVWQLALLPWFMALFHGDFVLVTTKLQWINHHNSWIILYSYLASNYFLFITDNFKKVLHALIVFLSAFGVDFIYSIVKWINNGFAFDRWQGSSGNPQLWAIQASMMLLLWLIVHHKIDELMRSKIYTRISLLIIVAAIFLTGSISNFIGLIFASLVWLLPWPSLSLFATLFYVIIVNLITVKFLFGYHGNVVELRNIFAGLSHKFIPRIKLWLNLLNEAPNHHLDYIWGMGVNAYNSFMAAATSGHHKNAHNLYFHNWLINGLLGLYLGSIFLFDALKQVLGNRYLLAIGLYILASSVFDCALTFIEVQMVFWLILPLLLEIISKSSGGTFCTRRSKSSGKYSSE